MGFSGRLLDPETLAAEIQSRPPVLLVHGDQDPMVPFESLGQAAAALTGGRRPDPAHVSRGTAHGIAPDGLGLALGSSASGSASRGEESRRHKTVPCRAACLKPET